MKPILEAWFLCLFVMLYMCSLHGPYFYNHNFHNISLASTHNGFWILGKLATILHLEYRNFMQPMGRLSMHSKCRDFLSIFPLFPIFSLQFPIGSHQVPNVFPKGVPNSTLLNPICFAQSSPLESKEPPIWSDMSTGYHNQYVKWVSSSICQLDISYFKRPMVLWPIIWTF